MVRVEKKDIKLVRDVGGQAFQMTLHAAEDRERLRRLMYDAQVKDGKFMPGPMSKYDLKKEAEQKSCCHPLGLKSCVLYHKVEEEHNETHC